MRKPTFREKLGNLFNGEPRIIGYEQKTGWKTERAIYEFTCKRHGKVQSHTLGYRPRLQCPLCTQELKELRDKRAGKI